MAFNNYNVPYSVIKFFEEQVLKNHDRVASFSRQEDIFFKVKLTNSEQLRIILLNDYCISSNCIHKVLREFSSCNINMIVTGGSWNGYSRSAKELGLNLGIGIFNISEFSGSLFWNDWISYHQTDHEGKPMYAYKTS